MARRSDHTRDELTKLILDAAFDLVSEGGYNQVSTRKIAADIGYTVGTLYNVFTNLNDIFIHVNARIIDILINQLKVAIEADVSAKESLSMLASEYLKFSKENYNLWNILFEYRFPDDQVLPNWYTMKVSELFGILEQVTSRLVNDPSKDIKSITTIIWAAIHGLCSLSAKGKLARISLNDSEKLVSQFIDSVVANLSKA